MISKVFVSSVATWWLLQTKTCEASENHDFQVHISNPNSWRMSFASCHDYPGDYADKDGAAAIGKPFNWDLIARRNPEAFVWGGDIIYGDFPKEMEWLPFPFTLFLPKIPIKSVPFEQSTPEKLNHMYQSLKKDEGYAALLNQLGGKGSKRHLGTWDDHDFGLNDGDKTLSIRNESKDAFLSFFDADSNDPRRARQGVYSSTLFTSSSGGRDDKEDGDKSSDKSVMVIALDMRYSKDPYNVEGGDFLGEEQWEWLEETLRNSKARAHVFISSLQLLVQGREPISECWADFPDKREKFLRLLHDLKVKSPLVVSGDVHFAEVMETYCGEAGDNPEHLTKGVVELTTSGLTHAWGIGMGHVSKEINRITSMAMFIYQHVYPWGYQSTTSNNNDNNIISKFWKHESKDYYLSYNFGEIEFDWLKAQAVVRILDGESGEVVIEKTYPFVSLDMGNDDSDMNEKTTNNHKTESICHPRYGDISQLHNTIALVVCVSCVLCLVFAKPVFVYYLIKHSFRWLFKKENKSKGKKEN